MNAVTRVVTAVVLLAIVGCGGSSGGTEAHAACEKFVERRAGADLEFDPEAVTERRGGGWYVRSRADAGEGVFVYECVVAREQNAWRLVDLTTDRG